MIVMGKPVIGFCGLLPLVYTLSAMHLPEKIVPRALNIVSRKHGFEH